MARRCELTGKGVLVGNNVSHANNKTKRRYLPNLQKMSFASAALGRDIKFRACTNALRTIEHNGGLDAYLLKTSNDKLSLTAQRVKAEILKATATA